MKPGIQAPDIRRIGPYWRVRYPGSHFVLFKHRAQAEHAATLAWAQAAESAACVGMDAGRLIRARHLADRWGPPRLSSDNQDENVATIKMRTRGRDATSARTMAVAGERGKWERGGRVSGTAGMRRPAARTRGSSTAPARRA